MCRSLSLFPSIILTDVVHSTPHPIVDPIGRVIGVLAGQPGAEYAEELRVAFQEIMREGNEAGLGTRSETGPHPRGAFPAYNIGVTGGNGNSIPVALKGNGMLDVLRRLLGHQAVKRMAMYQNGMFTAIFYENELTFTKLLLPFGPLECMSSTEK